MFKSHTSLPLVMNTSAITGYAAIIAIAVGAYVGMPKTGYRISSIPSNPQPLVGKVLEFEEGNGTYVAHGQTAYRKVTLVVTEGRGDSPAAIRYALQKGSPFTIKTGPGCSGTYSTHNNCVVYIQGNQISEVQERNVKMGNAPTLAPLPAKNKDKLIPSKPRPLQKKVP